jgi:hypothetical protein
MVAQSELRRVGPSENEESLLQISLFTRAEIGPPRNVTTTGSPSSLTRVRFTGRGYCLSHQVLNIDDLVYEQA